MLRWVTRFFARFDAFRVGFDRDLIGLDTPFDGFGGVLFDVSRTFAETLTFVKCFTRRNSVPHLYG